jgi:flagella basal body P-ring formation protein FlgA
MKSLKNIFYVLLLSLAQAAPAQDSNVWQLVPTLSVDGSGIFLDQIVVTPTATVVLPHLRLAESPNSGQTVSLSRNQIIELVQKQTTSELLTTNWSGATQVRVSRRTHQFVDSDLMELLAATLQSEFVKTRGELELHLTRPWTPVTVPDGPLTLKVSELPVGGVSSTFVATCELRDGRQKLGSWQVAVQASIWRDVPIARSPLTRGQSLKDADITMERRDLLLQRDLYLNFPPADDSLELAENVAVGMPVLNRTVRVRPTILRGRIVEGVFHDGSLSISLKVETLEDGLLGQTVRVRNPNTKRELYGKVQNEQTVLITL